MNWKDEVEKAAEEYIDYVLDSNCDVNYMVAFKAGAEWAKPKWISVKDRLPDKDGRYLVRGAPKSGCNGDSEEWVTEDYYTAFNGKFEGESSAVPTTHWMPLPEAPENEE